MELVEGAVLWPSTCICGEAHGPMVSTGHDLPWGERDMHLYLCVRCATEAGGKVGMAAGDDLAAVSSRLALSEARVIEQDGELAELRPIRSALDGASRRFADLAAADEPVRPTARKPREKVA